MNHPPTEKGTLIPKTPTATTPPLPPPPAVVTATTVKVEAEAETTVDPVHVLPTAATRIDVPPVHNRPNVIGISIGVVAVTMVTVIEITTVGIRGGVRVEDLAPSRDRAGRKAARRQGAAVVVGVGIGIIVGVGVGVETRFEGVVVRTIDVFHVIEATAVATALLHALVVEWVHPMTVEVHHT